MLVISTGNEGAGRHAACAHARKHAQRLHAVWGVRSALGEVGVDHLPSGRDELARAVQRRAAHGRAPCRRRQRNLWLGARADVEQRAWILARSLDQSTREIGSVCGLEAIERLDLAGDQTTCKALPRVGVAVVHEMSKTATALKRRTRRVLPPATTRISTRDGLSARRHV